MTKISSATRALAIDCSAIRVARWIVWALVSAGVFLVFCSSAHAQTPEIFLPPGNSDAPIQINAQRALRWRQGVFDRFLLQGDVRVQQGLQSIRGDQMVVSIDAADPAGPKRVIVYVEGNAVVEWDRDISNASTENSANPQRIVDERWHGRLQTNVDLQFEIAQIDTADPGNLPAIVATADAARAQGTDYSAAPVQFQSPRQESLLISPQTGVLQPATQNPQALPNPAVMSRSLLAGRQATPTRVEIHPRQSSVPLNIKTLASDTPGEQVLLASGGVRLTIDSREIAQRPELRGETSKQIYILADNAVVWSNALDPTQPAGDENAHWEVYLEGNVVFSVGRRTIYANQMYYDASYQRGTILRAEFYTPTQTYQGLVRLKADVLQQLDENNFQAFGAALTSSRIGVPRYWLQSDRVGITGTESYAIDPATGLASVDPETGLPATEQEYFAESRGNRVYVGSVPIFYWPSIRTSLEDPSFYLKSVKIGNDRIFGTQVRARFDLYHLFGFARRVRGTNWVGSLDYLSDRGLGFGNTYDYKLDSLFGVPGQVDGIYRSWFINDSGRDNLGLDRRAVPLEEDFRGLIFLNHRHRFSPDLQLKAEIGYLSDRNFLEQYYQQEWDWNKDYTTGVHLERLYENQSFDLWGQVRINDFFTQTDWLPRADHFILGESILGDRLVYHAHSHIGYGSFRPADAPINPVDLAKFDPLAWETAGASGVRAGTRHELDLPFQAGPVKLVPYVLADGTYWQNDLDGSDLFRVYGQTGLRGSLPFWRVDPTIHSTLFNVHGLAHKVTLDAEFAYADASQNFDRLPLYDPLDDDAQEFFRRRLAFDTFGIVPGMDVPLAFDERDFARRYAMQSYVTSPTAEVADDLMFLRTGLRQRWQTKRGLPGREKIIDWISFDVDATFFPRANRDNFGEDVGLIDYDFRWFVGDRLSVLSDGFFDFISQGLKTASVGVELHRPVVGDLYLGVRSIEGPISSNVLLARWNYRMSDKWGIQANSSYDFGTAGNIGQRFAAVYIGESFLYRLGVNYDVSRDNVGFLFGIEPRFLVRPQLFRPGLTALPPPSAEYLE